MLFEDPSRKYPHLVQALNTLGRRTVGEAPASFPRVLTFVGIGLMIGLMALGQITGLAMVFMAAILIASALAFRPQPRQDPTPAELRAMEATLVARRMSEMLSKRRLHRDIDEASLTLMEECARHWGRAHAELDGPFWSSADIPAHYQNVRRQAIGSLDEAMDEVLLHYRAWVPDEVANRHALDYVEEAIEQINPRGARRAQFIPPQFYPVRAVAEKLRELADESERIAREIRLDPNLDVQGGPAKSLDQTLSELRQIREAEDELRQSVRR